MSRINNTQVDHIKGIDVAMYNLLEYSNIYSKTLETLLQYYRNEPALGNIGTIVDFTDDNTADSFKFK